MFNRLFSKKKEPEASKPIEKEQIEEKGGDTDSASQLWKGLKKKDKGKTFRRLRDVFIRLPPALSNRVKEIDYMLSQTLVETHKNLLLILNEVQAGNEGNRLFLEQSEEWEEWFNEFQKKTTQYRLGVKEAVQGLVERLSFEDSEIKKIETILSGSPTEVEELTGIDKIEDLKSNLIDIGVILGKESEFKIVQNIMDEPIRVTTTMTQNIVDSLEYNLDFFEKLMSGKAMSARKDIERCWKVLSTGKGEEEERVTCQGVPYGYCRATSRSCSMRSGGSRPPSSSTILLE